MSNTNQNDGNRPAQDIQEQIVSAGPTMISFADGFQSIATAYGDYTKKSFEDTRSFVEKLSGAKSLDKAIEIQTDFAKSAFETFVTESQKIGALYRDLAKQSSKPFGGFLAKVTPTNQ
jgi:phasin family protein